MIKCERCKSETELIASEHALIDSTGWRWFRHYYLCARCNYQQVEFEGVEDRNFRKASEAARRARQEGFKERRPWGGRNPVNSLVLSQEILDELQKRESSD